MKNFRAVIKEYAEAPITRHVILELLKDYRRPNDKISELIKTGELISIRKGMYLTGPKVDLPSPEPFLIANHLRGPSYVSLESALSFWNMIPERVYEVSSATIKSSKKYINKVGRFSYFSLKTPYYSYGIKRIEHSPKQIILIATAEKALTDKIVLTSNLNLRSVKQTQEYLMEDLRLDYQVLKTLDTDMISLWIEHAPKKRSLEMLIKTIRDL